MIDDTRGEYIKAIKNKDDKALYDLIRYNIQAPLDIIFEILYTNNVIEHSGDADILNMEIDDILYVLLNTYGFNAVVDGSDERYRSQSNMELFTIALSNGFEQTFKFMVGEPLVKQLNYPYILESYFRYPNIFEILVTYKEVVYRLCENLSYYHRIYNSLTPESMNYVIHYLFEVDSLSDDFHNKLKIFVKYRYEKLVYKKVLLRYPIDKDMYELFEDLINRYGLSNTEEYEKITTYIIQTGKGDFLRYMINKISIEYVRKTMGEQYNINRNIYDLLENMYQQIDIP